MANPGTHKFGQSTPLHEVISEMCDTLNRSDASKSGSGPTFAP